VAWAFRRRKIVMSDQLSVSVTTGPSHVVVGVSGDWDTAGPGGFRDAVKPETLPTGTRLIVDLSLLGFMATVGVYELVCTQDVLKELGGTLALAAPQKVVRRMLELSGVDERIAVYGTVAEALGN
jgi:anti-sigma B factor antagonist